MFDELLLDALYLCLPEFACFDGEGAGDGAGDDRAGDGAGDDAGDVAGDDAGDVAGAGKDGGQAGRTFTQEDLDRIVQERLARDRKSREEQNRKLETQLQEMLKNKELTDQERARLEESLDDVQKQLRAKETEASRAQKQIREEYEKRLSEAEKRAQAWESKFRESSIERALQDAATANDAYNSTQVVRLLRPMTKLVEKKDEVTGQTSWQTVVDFPDVDEKGEPVITQRAPDETVKRMKEVAEYANLFKSNVVSGIGANSATGGITPGANGRVDVSRLTVEQYAKLRKENPELLGL